MSLAPFSLRGLTGVVTGAGRGIGRALACALAEAGANVVACDLCQADVEETAERIASRGVEALAAVADVTSEADVERMVQCVNDRFGRLDVLVNNAGTTVQKPATEITLEEWNRVLAVNLTGTFLCSRKAAPLLARGGNGAIVNIGSINGQVAPALHPSSAYSAAKAGVLGLTRALAVEWATLGVRVNAVCPTYVRTEMTAARLRDPEYAARIENRTPLGRIAEPDDLAGAVVFLASPASGMVTGHALNVDGGWVIV